MERFICEFVFEVEKGNLNFKDFGFSPHPPED